MIITAKAVCFKMNKRIETWKTQDRGVSLSRGGIYLGFRVLILGLDVLWGVYDNQHHLFLSTPRKKDMRLTR
jgi:hypothetical protein